MEQTFSTNLFTSLKMYYRIQQLIGKFGDKNYFQFKLRAYYKKFGDTPINLFQSRCCQNVSLIKSARYFVQPVFFL